MPDQSLIDAELTRLLGEVLENGAPAQRAQAQALMSRLGQEAGSAAVREDVVRLVDAYRNDPYLWR